jgi:hypothetical protein
MLVYGVQKAPLSIVGFILLVITLVNWMFRKILGTQVITNIFGDVSQYMIEPIVKTLVETPSIMTIIPYIIYIAICIVLSILVFRKKELEF